SIRMGSAGASVPKILGDANASVGGFGAALASAECRLPESLHFTECDVILGVVRARSVHKIGYGHNRDWSAAYPLVARGAEAGDRCGVVRAGLVGLDSCSAI